MGACVVPGWVYADWLDVIHGPWVDTTRCRVAVLLELTLDPVRIP